jgi:hypothetical protein
VVLGRFGGEGCGCEWNGCLWFPWRHCVCKYASTTSVFSNLRSHVVVSHSAVASPTVDTELVNLRIADRCLLEVLGIFFLKGRRRGKRTWGIPLSVHCVPHFRVRENTSPTSTLCHTNPINNLQPCTGCVQIIGVFCKTIYSQILNRNTRCYYHLKEECLQFHSDLKCTRCAPHV